MSILFALMLCAALAGCSWPAPPQDSEPAQELSGSVGAPPTEDPIELSPPADKSTDPVPAEGGQTAALYIGTKAAGFTEYTMNYEGELALELLFRHEEHLYYLHIMLLVYFFLPVTRLIAARADQRLLEYYLAAYHPCPRRSVSALVLPAGFLLAFGGTWAAFAAVGKPDGHFLEGVGVGMFLVALRKWGCAGQSLCQSGRDG